jgi:hypothetical protein
MREISYDTSFKTSVDQVFYEDIDFDLPNHLEDHLFGSGLADQIIQASNDWLEESHYGKTLMEIAEEDKKSTVLYHRYIQSIVGDDEVTTTDASSLGPLVITAATIISGIKLSRHDMGMSKDILNYAGVG